MEKMMGIFYLTVVFLLVVVFLLFNIFIAMDRYKSLKRKAPEPKKPSAPEPVIDVVGKSTTVFLAPLPPAGIEPMMSEDLETEMKSEAETEPDIKPEEVEANLNASYVPGEDELEQYANDDMDLTGCLSQGLSFEQISHAIDVVEGKKSGKNDEVIAGETFSVMPTDFLDMICMQTDHEIMVKKLIAGYLDSVGKMKPVPVPVKDFDINKYV